MVRQKIGVKLHKLRIKHNVDIKLMASILDIFPETLEFIEDSEFERYYDRKLLQKLYSYAVEYFRHQRAGIC